MAKKVSYLIVLQNRFSRKASDIKNSISGITTKLSKLKKNITSVQNKFRSLGVDGEKFGRKMVDIGGALKSNVTEPLFDGAKASLVMSAKIETLSTSFKTLTGGVDKAATLMRDLQDFTATTPFQLEGVGKSGKVLLAFKVGLADIIPRLRMLGDVASGADVPLIDLANIFGKVKAKGKLMTEEILQFAERGIPIIDVLSEKFKVSKQEIFKLASQSRISFDAMQGALVELTSKGGIFFEQTKSQSKTLAGLFSTLKDNMDLTAATIGDVVVDVFDLKEGLSGVSEFFGKMRAGIKSFAKSNPILTKIAVVFLLVLAVLGPIIIFVGQLVIAFAALSIAASILGISMAPILITIALVVAAIAAIIVIAIVLKSKWGEMANFLLSPFDLLIGKTGATRAAIGDMISFVIDSVKELVDAISNMTISEFFDSFNGAVLTFGRSLVDFALKPLRFIIDKFVRLKAIVSDFFTGSEAKASVEVARSIELSGGTTIPELGAVQSSSTTNVEIKLKSPPGTVDSVSRKDRGNASGLRVGMNMETTSNG